MYTKLTLTIDKDTIEQAKDYAKQQKLSLSKLIEAYLQSLTKKHDTQHELSPLVAKLSGIIPADYHEKTDYRNHQVQKHS
jgi:hypothetical protein